ncbi:lytic transglycosylase domain-containing protein [Acidocella sp. MX-AZ02]|uniref:lytic transglycosylase domain-containing protein n=1 Tax=Acidocella sp. MX-AZ02 TaxID=1214225 RepID=UPI00028CAE3C|nr:lytic transglycosylase domain-containing protein [Acidocella sp. MX-AZ02]EKN00065.1 putative soluble lytic murein transglycosylase [Acidocella sp. MX-AZ02]
MKFLAVLPLLLMPACALAQTAASPQIMEDVHAGNFSQADQLAAATGDPLVEKLVTFFRMTSSGGASADEIAAFIKQNPDWPEQGLLALREQQASGLYQPATPEMTPDFITQVEALHAAGQDQQAASLWQAQGKSAMAAADAGQQLMFWPAQNSLARALLQENDAKDAYQVVIAVDPPIAGSTAREQIADRDFLAGFILLRFLNQPQEAATWFQNLASSSTAVITQARAYYWLGRSESGAQAAQDYARAANYPTTFYGQLAALALGESPQQLAARIKAVPEPGFTMQDALDFGLGELPRAGVLLMQMGDAHDAAIFLTRAGQTAVDDRNRMLAARLALALGFPQSSVAIARLAGISGQMLVREGWPIPYQPPASALPPAVSLGIMRQESSFNPSVVSGAGAVGLMQLLPSTARLTGRRYGLPADNLFDPSQNMALGAAYLSQEVNNFGTCLPLAIAAYNAGPGNVARWLGENGDPELGSNPGGANMLDWLELIPFNETRNYVQRVSENITIYGALLNGEAVSPVAKWLTQK